MSDVALPDIVDVGQVYVTFPDGKTETLCCVVLEYVDQCAQTFSSFLKQHPNLTEIIFDRFIERVGGALAAIEGVGLTHGDLHEGNILVVPNQSGSAATNFWVIDFIGTPSIKSRNMEVSSDLDHFRNHLLQAAVVACEKLPGYSSRLLLGERAYRVLDGLRSRRYKNFAEMMHDFQNPRTVVPKSHFKAPAEEPFEWLRVEFIPTADKLFKLFEPDSSRFKVIARFGNTWISGPRGCGKSHYLRVLQFHPQVIIDRNHDAELDQCLNAVQYDFREAFGVLFACRLGEFKAFTPEAMGGGTFDNLTQRFLKHIVVLKIWTKTLQTIREGLEYRDEKTGASVLTLPGDFSDLVAFLDNCLGKVAVFDDGDKLNVFRQCLGACTAMENSASAIWYDPAKRINVNLLNEKVLDEFFAVLKRTFPDLTNTKFYILVDDAGVGNVHLEMQKILNSLVRSTSANHCFKLTCEKFMYTLDTADGKSIDPRHEVTYVSLGELSAKTLRASAAELSQYMARVVDRRLRAAGFKFGIESILGKSQDVREFLSALSQPGARRPMNGKSRSNTPRKRAYFGGWNIVWSISHGSVRSLLEIVEHIFNENHVTVDTEGVSLEKQDDAIWQYSRRQFKALILTPGEVDDEPIGPKLQAIISAIGEVSRLYLERYDTHSNERWYETISIERLDIGKLSAKSRILLEELIKNGLLLDDGATFSRAQFGLSRRYDLNKIFSPAFAITYRVRNHLYLSKGRLELLLNQPDAFVAKHRHKLEDLTQRENHVSQPLLFKENEPL